MNSKNQQGFVAIKILVLFVFMAIAAYPVYQAFKNVSADKRVQGASKPYNNKYNLGSWMMNDPRVKKLSEVDTRKRTYPKQFMLVAVNSYYSGYKASSKAIKLGGYYTDI